MITDNEFRELMPREIANHETGDSKTLFIKQKKREKTGCLEIRVTKIPNSYQASNCTQERGQSHTRYSDDPINTSATERMGSKWLYADARRS